MSVSLVCHVDKKMGDCAREHIIEPPPTFDFDALLQAAPDRAIESNPLLSLSPLTTPESTPPPTRTATPEPAYPSPEKQATSDKRRAMAFPNSDSLDLIDAKREKGGKSKRRDKQRDNRSHKRMKVLHSNGVDEVSEHYNLDHHINPAIPLPMDLDIGDSKVASSGYIGLKVPTAGSKDHSTTTDPTNLKANSTEADSTHPTMKAVYPLEILLDMGMILKKWDGSQAIPIIDRLKRVIAVLVGMPKDNEWAMLMKQAADALEAARQEARLSESSASRGRGNYSYLHSGVSQGGGQKKPMNMDNSQCATNRRILKKLHGMKCFQRLGGFSSGAMKTWSPDLHKHYADCMDALKVQFPKLTFLHEGSIFPAATYNLGPRTATFRHLDTKNLAFGWCAITALGDFDHEKSGHLVLWDLNLIIQFPSGSTILIPSAILSHSNTSVGDEETRYSFTQYAAGGLFRFVDNGFRTFKALSRQEQAERTSINATQWSRALSLFRIWKD